MRIRAAVLEQFGRPLVVQEIDLAEPRAGEVLVRLVACGVCHTDLYTASGADPSAWSRRATTSSPCSRPSAANACTASAPEPTSAWRSGTCRARASFPTAPR